MVIEFVTSLVALMSIVLVILVWLYMAVHRATAKQLAIGAVVVIGALVINLTYSLIAYAVVVLVGMFVVEFVFALFTMSDADQY